FLSLLPRPPPSPLFPYTTLFRSHLVLESLSGRALRRREHGIFLSVLRGAAAAVGMDGTLRRPAGDPAVRQPRRGKIRSAPRHSIDRKSTRLNSSHVAISYAVFCL